MKWKVTVRIQLIGVTDKQARSFISSFTAYQVTNQQNLQYDTSKKDGGTYTWTLWLPEIALDDLARELRHDSAILSYLVERK